MTRAQVANSLPIDMPYGTEAAAVLTMWREVEQQLNSVPCESDAATQLLDEWARLRTEYERLVELAAKHHRPLPERWPDD